MLESYTDDYDWDARPEIVTGLDLAQLKGRQFALITAFDVFDNTCKTPRRSLLRCARS